MGILEHLGMRVRDIEGHGVITGRATGERCERAEAGLPEVENTSDTPQIIACKDFQITQVITLTVLCRRQHAGADISL